MVRSWAVACALLLVACGGGEEPPQEPASVKGLRWQAVPSDEEGWYAIELRAADPCFVRFRVEGSNDGEHT